jgi:hypothetical protein
MRLTFMWLAGFKSIVLHNRKQNVESAFNMLDTWQFIGEKVGQRYKYFQIFNNYNMVYLMEWTTLMVQ